MCEYLYEVKQSIKINLIKSFDKIITQWSDTCNFFCAVVLFSVHLVKWSTIFFNSMSIQKCLGLSHSSTSLPFADAHIRYVQFHLRLFPHTLVDMLFNLNENYSRRPPKMRAINDSSVFLCMSSDSYICIHTERSLFCKFC
jgi:hypothetical protein